MKATAAETHWTQLKLKQLFYVGVSNVADYLQLCTVCLFLKYKEGKLEAQGPKVVCANISVSWQEGLFLYKITHLSRVGPLV